MPELPEVETVKRGLEKRLPVQTQILKFEFLRRDLRDPIPTRQLCGLAGARLLSISRRAKYILFTTTKGDFLSHLGMTGSWRVLDGAAQDSISASLHDHIRLHVETPKGETLVLVYNDPRRFGVFDILNDVTKQKRLQHLGPEPLEDQFHAAYLWQSLRGKDLAIKVAIMDQKRVVGVGNIYASEALFFAKIRPQTKASRVSLESCERLVVAVRQVLSRAIEAGGSSISDFVSTEGQSGYFQNQFCVYDRSGLSCPVCQTLIRSQVLGGRSSFWCSECQK